MPIRFSTHSDCSAAHPPDGRTCMAALRRRGAWFPIRAASGPAQSSSARASGGFTTLPVTDGPSATASASDATASPGRGQDRSPPSANGPTGRRRQHAATPPRPAALYGRRPGQSARRSRALSRLTLYRIHGSNEPHTIGQAVSSGCFRMTNEDVVDLYSRVRVGTKVIVQR